MPSVVTLTTDFGLQDSYVAEIKAVLLSQVPSVNLVDITHEIPPYNVEAGAFQLLRSYRWFPPSAFHLAVVDPGVGTNRRCLFVRTAHGTFIGPDNGVLLWAIRDAEKASGKKAQGFEIPVREAVRPTFYGRDVFAPFLALHLRGKKSRLLKLNHFVGDEFPEARMFSDRWEGKILYVDHFGNLVTSIPSDKTGPCDAKVKKHRLSMQPNYLSIGDRQAALIAGSHGFWEIAAKKSSAQKLLKVEVGEKVSLFPTKLSKS